MTRLAIISIGTRLEDTGRNAGATEICNQHKIHQFSTLTEDS